MQVHLSDPLKGCYPGVRSQGLLETGRVLSEAAVSAAAPAESWLCWPWRKDRSGQGSR